MTVQRAIQTGTLCGLIALGLATKMAGIWGMDRPSGGKGFFAFLLYVSLLLLGFILMDQFVSQTKSMRQQHRILSTAGYAAVSIPIAIAIFYRQPLYAGLSEVVDVFRPFANFIWFAPPLLLLGSALHHRATLEGPE